MGPLYDEQFFNIFIFALMIAKGWSYRLDNVCVCVGMCLSQMSTRGILFSSLFTPKAFLLEFIHICFAHADGQHIYMYYNYDDIIIKFKAGTRKISTEYLHIPGTGRDSSWFKLNIIIVIVLYYILPYSIYMYTR